MNSVGIIGFGSFGAFVAKWLRDDFKVLAFDVESVNVPVDINSSLEQVCGCDYVILAIPLSSYTSVLNDIRSKLGSETTIIDISSVKVKPISLIKELVPDQSFIAIHPLFGPESASDSLDGHDVIICESKGVVIDTFNKYLVNKGLNVIKMTADEHDREMSVVQALTFFLARGLNEFGLHKMKLKTPSFMKLLSLAQLDKHHSNDLLETILNGNVHAKAVRKDFMKDLEEYNSKLN